MALKHYILMGPESLEPVAEAVQKGARDFLATLKAGATVELPLLGELKFPAFPALDGAHLIKVVDSISDTGPKLVVMDETVAALATALWPHALRMVEEHAYRLPRQVEIADSIELPAAMQGEAGITVTVECRLGGVPAAGRTVSGYVDFAAGRGAAGTTDHNGRISLRLSGERMEVLLVDPGADWGAYRTDLAIEDGGVIPVDLEPLRNTDAARTLYPRTGFDAGAGVTVGLIDTGLMRHSDLNIAGRRNVVMDEAAGAVEDWNGHGTHVAGLVGASGAFPGLAPGVALRGYRVFGRNANTADSYALLKALFFAALDGCDIVNISLSGGITEAVLQSGIRDARNAGMLVIVAAGNENRRDVTNPAAYDGAIGVSAWGLRSAYPRGAYVEQFFDPDPHAANADEFIAAFSSVGLLVDVSAPGVGLISTAARGGYEVRSGTSMAAPVISGIAAALLSRRPDIRSMPRNANRAAAMETMLREVCDRRGFNALYVGDGLPDPARV